ncbi:amidohydrolase family protein [Roseomonas sp. CCTCC AB2023176]|uniref:amidohydrolase family protein n=1 Tax=Roseomonas sp. CCTCC AB2023176 TaxID=3342640 RepID=UPI0035E30613
MSGVASPMLPWGRLDGRTLLTARWVVGHVGGRHRLFEQGELVFEGERVVFVGHGFPGEVARRVDYGAALIGPGFVDLDALSDLDTTILGYDNGPAWKKGRVWPRDYVEGGPVEMVSTDELVFQKRYAFAHLLRNGITTALPIASLFYREWGETWDEFASAGEIAEGLGLRVYLGPAYRTGNQVVEADGTIGTVFDEERGLAGLAEAVRFCEAFEGRAGGLVRTMLAPDRVETCTPELVRRGAAAAREMGVPLRQHCCQSRIEYELVLRLRGMSPPEWLESLGALGPWALLPHGTFVSGSSRVSRPGRDLEIIRDSGAAIVHCPLVSARGGNVIESFARYRRTGIRMGMGTDTWPADMVANMQAGMMLCRVVESDAMACRSEDYYDAATVGGADALGRPDLGRLAVGAMADITVFDLSAPHLGQVIDPIQTMMIAGRGTDCSTVIVGGRASVQGGAIPGVDWKDFTARAQAQFGRVMAGYPRRTLGHPPVEEIFSSAYPVERRPGA